MEINDITICNLIDMAVDNKLMLDGNEPTPDREEAVKERIKYLKHLIEDSKDELEELEEIKIFK